jgi:hypothetical protein
VKVVRRYRYCRCVACFYTEWINDTDDCIPRQYADIARMPSDAGADPNMRAGLVDTTLRTVGRSCTLGIMHAATRGNILLEERAPVNTVLEGETNSFRLNLVTRQLTATVHCLAVYTAAQGKDPEDSAIHVQSTTVSPGPDNSVSCSYGGCCFA